MEIKMEVNSGTSCFYSSLANLFRYYSLSATELDIAIATNFMDFAYQDLQSSNILPGQRFFYKNHKDIINIIKQEFNATLLYCDNPQLHQETIEKILGDRNPLLLLIPSPVLSYTVRDFHPENVQEQHCVVLRGIDNKSGQGIITDCYAVDNSGNINVYSGYLSYNIILENTKSFIYTSKENVGTFVCPNIYELFRNHLKSFLLGCSEAHIKYGQFAIQQCIDDLLLYQPEEPEWLNQIFIDMSYMINAYIMRMNLYIKQFIVHMHLHDKFLQKADSVYRAWSGLCLKIWKASFRSNARMLNHFHSLLLEALNGQVMFMKQLLNYLSN